MKGGVLHAGGHLVVTTYRGAGCGICVVGFVVGFPE